MAKPSRHPRLTKGFPKHWCDDHLSDFIDMSMKNFLASFTTFPKEFALLSELDSIYLIACENLDHVKPWFEALFLLRAHSSFRAGVKTALTLQLGESFPQYRACLEQSIYAFFIYNERNLRIAERAENLKQRRSKPIQQPRWEIWLRRDESKGALDLCQNFFTIGNARRELESRAKKLSETFKKIYDFTITYGGHPNPAQFLTALQLGATPDSKFFHTDYFVQDHTVISHCIKVALWAGICSLSIFQLIYKHRFDLVGVTAALDALKNKSTPLIKTL